MALPVRVNRGQQTGLLSPFDFMQREFDNAIGRLFSENFRGGDGGSMLSNYGVDVREDADHMYVDADLPGFKKEEVDISLENGTLSISAEHHESREEPNRRQGQQQIEPQQQQQAGGQQQQQQMQQGDYLLRERRCERFVRSFTLPPTVDEQNVQAKLQDGVLHITLNKKEETKPKKIQVA